MAPRELYYNLTDDDTDQLASLASWRARLFGNTKRLRKQVPRLLLLSRPGILGSRFCPVFGGLSLHFLEGFLRWPFGDSTYPLKILTAERIAKLNQLAPRRITKN